MGGLTGCGVIGDGPVTGVEAGAETGWHDWLELETDEETAPAVTGVETGPETGLHESA